MTRHPHREILEEFAERAATSSGRLEEDFLESHALYLSPWRERMADNRLGPDFGPRTESAFIRALRDHSESKGGGGLWDDEEAARMNPRLAARAVVRSAARYDAAKMTAYVERHSAELPMREVEVYFALYRDGLSNGQAARALAISRNTFDTLLKRLRDRVKHARSKDKR